MRIYSSEGGGPGWPGDPTPDLRQLTPKEDPLIERCRLELTAAALERRLTWKEVDTAMAALEYTIGAQPIRGKPSCE